MRQLDSGILKGTLAEHQQRSAEAVRFLLNTSREISTREIRSDDLSNLLRLSHAAAELHYLQHIQVVPTVDEATAALTDDLRSKYEAALEAFSGGEVYP